MADDINPCRNTNSLENESFATNKNGKTVKRVEDECAIEKLEEVRQAVLSSGGGGGAGSSILQNELAGQTISAVRAVQLDGSQKLEYSTNDNTVAEAQTLGISNHAGVLDDSVEVVTFGPFTDSSITFAVNDCVYLGTNGQLTNVAPTTGVLLQLGKMIKPNVLFVDIEAPIIL